MSHFAADYHMHTTFSDGHDDCDDHARRARDLGLAEIGFSDHLVPRRLDGEGYGMARDRLGDYVAGVRSTGERFPQVKVLLGAEVDFTPDTCDEMSELVSVSHFDFVIGSVHFVDEFDFDVEDRRNDPRWDDIDALYRRFYELLCRAAQWGRFDVVGHFDLLKIWGHRPWGDVAAAEDAALDAIAAAGLAMELNTSGLRTEIGEVYPSASILAKARARDIPITFGSDAHHAADVGAGFAVAAAQARAAGYTSCLRLSDRRQAPLP